MNYGVQVTPVENNKAIPNQPRRNRQSESTKPRRMPPYTDKVLTDAQAADLFAYIKSLPASPSADQIPLLKKIMDAKN